MKVKFVVMDLPQSCQNHIPVCRHHRRSVPHTATGSLGFVSRFRARILWLFRVKQP